MKKEDIKYMLKACLVAAIVNKNRFKKGCNIDNAEQFVNEWLEKNNNLLPRVSSSALKKCHSTTTPPCYKPFGGNCENLDCEHYY